ncbi:MAG: tetratricopeptide repeat protein, partial [Sphaerochaetaceae bacterium]|nr:tetratricopeptide repeat protein [Sphaerochaetaceae bacterium]
YLEIALELDEDNVKLLSNLAYLHIRSEEFNRAHELLLRGQAIDPNDPAIKHLQSQLGIEEDDNVIDG